MLLRYQLHFFFAYVVFHSRCITIAEVLQSVRSIAIQFFGVSYSDSNLYPLPSPPSGFLPNYLLPDYEEVVNRPPTPPPPYSALQTGPSSVASSPMTTDQQDGHCPVIQTNPVPPVSDTLCSRPSMEEPHTPTIGYRHKPPQTAQEGGVLQDGLTMEGPTSQEKRGGGGGDSCKDPPLKDLGGSEGSAEDKERLPSGRMRRFTGDSGIEVCVCGVRGNSGCSGGGGVGQEGKELESLLRHEGEEEAGDFCDSCGHRAPSGAEDEQAPGELERRVACGPSGAPQPAQQTPASLHTPVCLFLHTINEQEGPHHGSSTEPQG